MIKKIISFLLATASFLLIALSTILFLKQEINPVYKIEYYEQIKKFEEKELILPSFWDIGCFYEIFTKNKASKTQNTFDEAKMRKEIIIQRANNKESEIIKLEKIPASDERIAVFYLKNCDKKEKVIFRIIPQDEIFVSSFGGRIFIKNIPIAEEWQWIDLLVILYLLGSFLSLFILTLINIFPFCRGTKKQIFAFWSFVLLSGILTWGIIGILFFF